MVTHPSVCVCNLKICSGPSYLSAGRKHLLAFSEPAMVVLPDWVLAKWVELVMPKPGKKLKCNNSNRNNIKLKNEKLRTIIR